RRAAGLDQRLGSRVSNRRLGRSGERRQQFCSNETQARVVSQLVFPPGELGDYKRAGFSHAASEPCLLRQGSAESGGTREKTGYAHSVEKRLRVCSRAACASLRSRFRSGRRPRFSSPWVHLPI